MLRAKNGNLLPGHAFQLRVRTLRNLRITSEVDQRRQVVFLPQPLQVLRRSVSGLRGAQQKTVLDRSAVPCGIASQFAGVADAGHSNTLGFDRVDGFQRVGRMPLCPAVQHRDRLRAGAGRVRGERGGSRTADHSLLPGPAQNIGASNLRV